MTWQQLATIQTSADWLLTESVSGSIFRITHNVTGTNIQSLRSVIAQAFDEGANNTYFDFRRLAFKLETEAFIFIQPPGLLNRKLAIKRLDNLVDDWVITIEVLDGMPESISLPIAINEVDGLEAALNDKARAESLNIHVADTENPHGVTPGQIGAEAAGAVANAITTHEKTVNHPLVSDDSEFRADGFMRHSDKLKLDTIEQGATANATDAQLRSRSTHTGTQPVETITGLGNAAARNIGTVAGTVAAGDDIRLSNARIPTGTAGSVLSGTYPNPSFAAGVFARSLGNPGWEKLHSGKIVQWGSSIVNINANGGGTVVFSMSFPLNVFVVFSINGDVGTGNLNIFPAPPPYALTGFNFGVTPNPGSGFVRVNWFAIGN